MARRFRDMNARTTYPATNPALTKINAKIGLNTTTCHLPGGAISPRRSRHRVVMPAESGGFAISGSASSGRYEGQSGGLNQAKPRRAWRAVRGCRPMQAEARWSSAYITFCMWRGSAREREQTTKRALGQKRQHPNVRATALSTVHLARRHANSRAYPSFRRPERRS